MKRIPLGTIIAKDCKRYAVVEVLDCPASYEPTDEAPELPAVVVSPVKGDTVLGRIRRVIEANRYVVVGGVVEIPEYRIRKEDNEV
jgi:hypothetical protein